MSGSIQSVYEKMKENPGFNKRVFIEQPTPFNEENVSPETQRPAMPQLNEMDIIKKRLNEIEKALKLIMETHKVLLRR